MVQCLTMTRVPLSSLTVMVYVLTLHSSSASPLFSIGGDKPTPIRYTLRVERLVFGGSERDDEFDDNNDWEECPEEEYPPSGDNQEEDETNTEYYEENLSTEEEYPGTDENQEEEETPPVYYEENPITEEEYPGIVENQEEEETPPEYYEENPSTEEEYPGIDENQEEDDTYPEYYEEKPNIEYPDIEGAVEVIPDVKPHPKVNYPSYKYSDDSDTSEGSDITYYSEDYEQNEEEAEPLTEQEIVSLRSVKKRPSHRQQAVDGLRRNMNHLPTLMKAMRRKAVAARSHKSVADLPLSPKRHHLKRRHNLQGHKPL